MQRSIIGIDFGTTNSVCAYMDRNGPRVIINEEGGRVTPSVVGFSREGDRFVGEVAKRQLLINPEATIATVKRFMGRKFTDCQDDLRLIGYNLIEGHDGDAAIEVEGQTYTPQEITAMILQKVRKSAEEFLGGPVSKAVITVPAYFTDRQRQATRDAGTIAGLDVLRIINEPTAAALAYVSERGNSCNIAVYDFGGGTFDISILHVSQNVAEVLATRGNNTLGGADIDRLLVDWLLEKFQEEHGLDVSSDRVVLQRLRDAAERAKIDLSTTTTAEIHLPFLVADAGGPKHLQVTLTRPEFEGIIEPLVRETITECESALTDGDLTVADIDEIVLVGGSSRIPLVQNLVQGLFACPLNKGFNPDEVVAIGASVQAGMLQGDIDAVTLLDVTNFSLGIEVRGRRFAKLIPKNSPIPTQTTKMVTTVVDNQRTVKIHVLQGEHNDVRYNTSLGDFELRGLPAERKGVPRVQVKFAIDASGMVKVTAKDLRTGSSEAITIQSDTALTPEEIARLRSDMSTTEAVAEVR